MIDLLQKPGSAVKIKPKIWLSSPHMGKREQEFINEAFQGNWIAPIGPNIDGFESALADYLEDDKYVVALNSGTAAIHLALILLGVGKDDEVMCQSMTFSASANPIVYQGAIPVFIDSEPDTWNMSPEHLEIAIKHRLRKGKKVKAIIVVHLYGMPAKMNEICQIAEKYEIPIIEDAAEAMGSSYDGKKMSTFGRFACISFNGNKIITTSGGGALVCQNRKDAENARFLATQARDPAPHYQHSQIGYNYRMSNICAGIGRGQLMVLNERVAARREIFNRYKTVLQRYPGISFQPEPIGTSSNRWLTTMLIDPYLSHCHVTQEQLRHILEAENIETRPLWKPLHMQPVFKDAPYFGEGISEELFHKGICLPSGSNMSLGDIRMIIGKITASFK
ncbi:MAG: aminotransferase class I/II-fold pyridoxal phosphate-dependent enzyme [Ferruginibacter sp.]